jgi:prevent-host-death family protein
MSSVGIRDLKASLSRIVSRAASGETIVVTEHGHPVALLTPLPPGVRVLDRLRSAGRVRWAGGKPVVAPLRVRHPRPDLAAAIVEERQA